MSERIRYAWGQSSLGDFIAAISDEGLVAFEFMKRSGGVPAALRERFPGAAIDLDEAGLADVVGRLAAVVERPDVDAGLPLDMRGSDYQKKVWGILCRVPAGQTTSYGAIAAEMGTPLDARDVTDAIANNMIARLLVGLSMGGKAQARAVGARAASRGVSSCLLTCTGPRRYSLVARARCRHPKRLRRPVGRRCSLTEVRMIFLRPIAWKLLAMQPLPLLLRCLYSKFIGPTLRRGSWQKNF